MAHNVVKKDLKLATIGHFNGFLMYFVEGSFMLNKDFFLDFFDLFFLDLVVEVEEDDEEEVDGFDDVDDVDDVDTVDVLLEFWFLVLTVGRLRFLEDFDVDFVVVVLERCVNAKKFIC